MSDNDAEKPAYKPLKASNTVASLTPREVNSVPFSAADEQTYNETVQAPIGQVVEPLVQKTDWPTATLPSPGYAGAPADVPPELENAGNVLPVDWPTVQETMGLPETISYSPGLRARVAKLEEQVDGLLDRIAKYNFRAQHRI